jgi:hypothetical protein
MDKSFDNRSVARAHRGIESAVWMAILWSRNCSGKQSDRRAKLHGQLDFDHLSSWPYSESGRGYLPPQGRQHVASSEGKTKCVMRAPRVRQMILVDSGRGETWLNLPEAQLTLPQLRPKESVF